QGSSKEEAQLSDFDASKSVPSFLPNRLSSFAHNKIENLEYETFGFTHTDDVIALKPLASFRTSRHAIPDCDLSWQLVSMGSMSLLQQLEESLWPQKHISSLLSFFWTLHNHPFQTWPYGESALIAYQTKVHHAWHD
ncbi:hypothetical protein BKA93DRAFT_709463, partial [Sparassis latifolia]